MIPTPRAQMSVSTTALLVLDVGALWAGWIVASNVRLGSYWGNEFRLQHEPELLMHATVFFIAGVFFERQALVVTSGDVGAPRLGELKRAASAVYQIQGYVATARDMSA